ncbi:polysaccharide pyruvyl transferase family protein [Aeromonas caviae]|uniref:polysaccharide pyruvyl transferase family protein n=1 Tax=Aeromonas caviae TaxID=648 RepID=UPI00214F3B54|nr:polysaccharide pyruvyl transferase family protein [Aeromonas caviae]MCR3937440.1 polysaccharide pyruvyl transferase family protein [Aeromonas caviae]
MRKNKIGIVTFNKAHNYGALLQAYALKKAIERFNADVVFVDFTNEYLDKNYRLFPSLQHNSFLGYCKTVLTTALDFPRKKRRHDTFSYFINKYLPMENIDCNKLNLDCIFLGSDQIWNPRITGKFEGVFFGKHQNLNAKRIVSYAASMGNGMVDTNLNAELRNYLDGIDVIGVRESSLKGALSMKLSIESVQNLDPTLLLERDEWLDITDDTLVGQDKYILVYEVEHHLNTQNIINTIVEKTGFKVKVISAKTNYKVPRSVISTASPKDFISLFRNASFVVTTSFHGTVFSIINNVPFYTLKFGNGVDNRSLSLLSMLNLTARHINDVNEIRSDFDMLNFDEANQLLNEQRNKSLAYLSENISNH